MGNSSAIALHERANGQRHPGLGIWRLTKTSAFVTLDRWLWTFDWTRVQDRWPLIRFSRWLYNLVSENSKKKKEFQTDLILPRSVNLCQSVLFDLDIHCFMRRFVFDRAWRNLWPTGTAALMIPWPGQSCMGAWGQPDKSGRSDEAGANRRHAATGDDVLDQRVVWHPSAGKETCKNGGVIMDTWQYCGYDSTFGKKDTNIT